MNNQPAEEGDMVEHSGASSSSEALGSPDEQRGAATVDEAVAKAEEGSQVEAVHSPPEPGDSGQARREEIGHVEGATEGRVERYSAGPPTGPEPGPAPTEIGSGGAQRIAGARISDRVAGGAPLPDGPPFDTDSDDS